MLVIFVCTGNTCRSPMAEKIFCDMTKGMDITVESRGVMCEEGAPMNLNARLVMRDMGLDTVHRSRSLTIEDIEMADYIITMTASHKEYIVQLFGDNAKVHTLAEYSGNGDVLDPYGGDVFEYARCARKLVADLNVFKTKVFN